MPSRRSAVLRINGTEIDAFVRRLTNDVSNGTDAELNIKGLISQLKTQAAGETDPHTLALRLAIVTTIEAINNDVEADGDEGELEEAGRRPGVWEGRSAGGGSYERG